MSKPNGRQKHAIENLAAALNECFDAAVEKAADRAADRVATRVTAELKSDMDARFDKQDDTLQKQDATLRIFWNQLGGSPDQHLPIDD